MNIYFFPFYYYYLSISRLHLLTFETVFSRAEGHLETTINPFKIGVRTSFILPSLDPTLVGLQWVVVVVATMELENHVNISNIGIKIDYIPIFSLPVKMWANSLAKRTKRSIWNLKYVCSVTILLIYHVEAIELLTLIKGGGDYIYMHGGGDYIYMRRFKEKVSLT